MAKKVREENKWTIPSDWDEETDGFQLAVICVPNSRQWRGIFTGQISDLSYGRNYNKLTGTITDAQAVARDIFESMAMTCLDDMIIAIQCICEANSSLVEKAETTTQQVDPEASDGVVEFGDGQQFPDSEAFLISKCNVANAIYDTTLETVQWLRFNNVDLKAGFFGGVTSGLIMALLLSGPIGWALALVEGIVVGLAGFLLGTSLNFVNMEAALVDVKTEAILGLFNASDTNAARSNFTNALDNSAVSLTSLELQFFGLLLASNLLNQLFEPREDMSTYEAASPVICPTGYLVVWDFDSDYEGWTFVDNSEPGATAVRSYNSAEESIANQLTSVNDRARGENTSPAIAQAVDIGNSVQFDYSRSTDGLTWGKTIKVIYDDLSEFFVTRTDDAGPSTLVLDITTAGTIEYVEIELTRGNGSRPNYDIDVQILEVRVQ